ncbi:MAG: bacillithiol biosynthesis deacetylase BshB1 [Ignavibacteria bacterium]|nr:bacillithiol biosynthesis deacetylase BshB1 [Ignavibacteria bacterium]
MDVLFFAAHPDDAELCCGGTIAALVKAGKKVGIADLTRGELGTRGSVSLRKKEADAASLLLGIAKRINLGLPDGNIQNTLQNRVKIIKVIRQFQPAIIFFPHLIDRHPDHYNTHFLVKEAAFYSGLQKIKTNGFKAFRPKKNIYYMQSIPFEPNLIFDISDTFKLKKQAIECYSSQFYTGKNRSKSESETYVSSKKFMEYIDSRAKFYGFQAGVLYGEAYFIEEKIKTDSDILFKI